MKHYYYLHTDGNLIHKNASVVDADASYFDSAFVRKVWMIDTEDRGSLWILLTEALALGANKSRIQELQTLWKMTNDDAHEFAKRTGLKFCLDGDQWCVTFEDFVDLQTSQAGFGNDCLEALADLANQGFLEKR